jgi:hypothetical protein
MAERYPSDDRGAASETTEDGALEATGAYRTEDGVVLYDTERPLAWVQSSSSVSLDEMA